MKKIIYIFIFLLPIILFSCSGSNDEVLELKRQLEIAEQKNQQLINQNHQLINEAEAKEDEERKAKVTQAAEERWSKQELINSADNNVSKILEEYKINPVSFHHKYKSERIIITDVIFSIDFEHLFYLEKEYPALKLGSYPPTSLTAYFPKNSGLVGMKKGDIVTVSCELLTRESLDESFTLYPCSFEDSTSITKLPLSPMGLSALSLWTKGYELYEVKNYTEAINYFKKSADQGYDSAQTSLGNMYRAGLGVTQNYSEAVRLYRLAADQGYAIAQYNLGTMYENGEGVTRNYSEARKWYTLAANQGDELAKERLEIIKNK